MGKYHVTRIRHVLEGAVVEAPTSTEAIAKSRKLKRKEWNHIESARRRGYKAETVNTK